jgi:hypothetical protein
MLTLARRLPEATGIEAVSLARESHSIDLGRS